MRPAAINALSRFQRGIAFAFFFAAQIIFAQTTNEAESAALANGARASDCKTCSGGKQVRFIGGNNNGTVTFTVKTARAGLYPLTVFYNVGDDRSFTITVNTNAQWNLIFPKTAGRNESSSKTLLVPLNAGVNSIRFANAKEAAPDLDCIVLAKAPVASTEISGLVTDANGAPVAGVEISLCGQMRMQTRTDAQGHYWFPFLPKGNYHVRAESPAKLFSPFENFCAAANMNANGENFFVRKPVRKNVSVMQLGKWRIEYDLNRGTADIFCDGKLLIPNAFAVVRLPETVTSMDYQSRKISHETVQDGFGRGVKYIVESSGGHANRMVQTFWFYEHADYFLADVRILGKPAVSSNFMSPLTTQTPVDFLPRESGSAGIHAGKMPALPDDRALFVPFDNDKWIRYDAAPFGGKVTSYEVSAFYDNTSREGLVIGSIEHDTWKTGVRSVTSSNAVISLEIFGGVTSPQTRDVLPHGKISGRSIQSPKIFVGWFSDWRDGLEAYAKANAVVAPPRVWTGGVPFGWNSWGKLQQRISFDKAIQVSDFFAKELQPDHFQNDGVVYIGLDSGWNKFSDAELKQFVAHCKANHQEAGIYFTPFAAWGAKDDAPVPGTKYKFKDIFLYAHGRKEMLDGGTALDPTHPGTKKLIAATIARFKKAGFAYVKADFLTHGALEADRHFDPRVTTGMQAYNEGMKFVEAQLGKSMYLNESIAPLFPAQYADSRRIACDSFGSIGQVEYTLNSLTYGWWLSKVYDFNDPDEIVLDGFSEGENRARVTSAAITGIFISGDDFSKGGSAVGKERAKQFLTNADVDNVARIKKTFRPVEGNTGHHAANLFTLADTNAFYLAAFNYSHTNAVWSVDFRRLGLRLRGPVEATELWSGATRRATNSMTIRLDATDAALYKLRRPDH